MVLAEVPTLIVGLATCTHAKTCYLKMPWGQVQRKGTWQQAPDQHRNTLMSMQMQMLMRMLASKLMAARAHHRHRNTLMMLMMMMRVQANYQHRNTLIVTSFLLIALHSLPAAMAVAGAAREQRKGGGVGMMASRLHNCQRLRMAEAMKGCCRLIGCKSRIVDLLSPPVYVVVAVLLLLHHLCKARTTDWHGTYLASRSQLWKSWFGLWYRDFLFCWEIAVG